MSDLPPVKRYRREDNHESKMEDEEDYVPYVSVKERRKQKLVKLGRITEIKDESVASGSGNGKSQILSGSATPTSGNSSAADEEEILASTHTSLLLQHSKLKKLAEAKQESEKEKRKKEEEMLLQSVKENTALMGANELAKGILYEDPIKTSWTPPKKIEDKPPEYHERYLILFTDNVFSRQSHLCTVLSG